jgi:hypothetical protein
MRQRATTSSENDEDCVNAGTMHDSNLMCECVVARYMIGMGEKEVVLSNTRPKTASRDYYKSSDFGCSTRPLIRTRDAFGRVFASI